MRNTRSTVVIAIALGIVGACIVVWLASTRGSGSLRDASTVPSEAHGDDAPASLASRSAAEPSELGPSSRYGAEAGATGGENDQAAARGLVVSGIVTSVTNGTRAPEPVSGATVELRVLGERGARVLEPIRTNRDGRFRVTVVDADPERTAMVSGFAWARGLRGDEAFESVHGGDVELEFQMHPPGGTVGGRVVDTQGAPVHGAMVALDVPADGDHDDHAYTDADGRYRLPYACFGAATLHARHETIGAATPVSVSLGPEGITRAPDLVLTGRELAGHVVDLDGRPVRCTVQAMARRYLASRGLDARGPSFEPPTSVGTGQVALLETDGLLVASTDTAADGTFRFVGLARSLRRPSAGAAVRGDGLP